MPRANPLQPSLNAGELSPRMAARVDFGKYPAGLAVCKNLISLPQGGISRRPGTRYVAEVKDSSAKCRLLRFEFSTTQAYVIEAGSTYFRFFRNQGQITVADTDAAILNGTFVSDISNWTDISNGTGSVAWEPAPGGYMKLDGDGSGNEAVAEHDLITLGANYVNQEHVIKFQVTGDVAGDKVMLRIGKSSGGTDYVNDVEFEHGYHCYPFTPDDAADRDLYIQFRVDQDNTVGVDNVSIVDNAAVEIDTPYATAELFGLKHAQTADVMYIAHPDHEIFKLSRSGHSAWSLTEVKWIDGPYLDANIDSAKTLTPSATSETITISATGHSPFVSTDVGRFVRIKHAADWGYAAITAYSSATSVTAHVERAFTATTASSDWVLGAWSDTTGYPAAVTFFEQRLAAASTANQRQTFWLSQSADLENMRPDSYDSAVIIEADDAFGYTFAADEMNAILWMSPGQKLVIGTSGGEWLVESDGPVLTPLDVQVRRQSKHGSANVEPARVGEVVLFVQKAKRKIREFSFSFEADGYRAPDLTILSDHVTRSKLVEMIYQQEPDSVLWCVREDGVCACMTYRRSQDVVGWSRQYFGGTFQGGDPVAESVAAIPGNNGAGQQFDSEERDETWFIVKRTIDGNAKRYVEFLEGSFEGPMREDYTTDATWDAAIIDAQKDAFYIDCGLTLDSPVTITGATAQDPVVISATAHGFSADDIVEITGVKGMTELNGNSYKAENVTAGTFELTNVTDTVEGTFNVTSNNSQGWGDAVANAKHHGLKFTNTNSGDVQKVRIRTTTTHSTNGNAVAGIYVDNSGSPGSQVAADSDTVSINAASTIFTFTWSSNAPTLSDNTGYWLVISNSDTSGDSTLETVVDQGSSFASGGADTVGGISDGSNGFSGDLKAEVTLSNNTDGSGFATYVAGGRARKKVTTVSGLSHLEGETVTILADGAVHADETVSSGSITLDQAAARVQVGLGYTHTMKSLKMMAGAAAGTPVGKIKRIHGVTLVLLDAGNVQIGPDEAGLKDVTFREVGDAMDTAVPLVTTEHFQEFDGDYERDPRIMIQGSAPLPFTLLALAPEEKTNDQV